MRTVNLGTSLAVGTNENLTESFAFWQDESRTVPISFAGHTVTFGMRSSAKKAGTDLTAVGGEVSISSNVISLSISPTRLNALKSGVYDFEILVTAPSAIKTVALRGKVNLRMGIAP